MSRSPMCMVIAGPNGSGKTTLKHIFIKNNFNYNPKVFINADEIKKEIGCSDKEAQDISYERLDKQLLIRESFIYETVFSHPSKLKLLENAKTRGFHIRVVFVMTENPNININRVARRVLARRSQRT